MNFDKKATLINKIEFWTATLIYMGCIFVLLGEAAEQPEIEYPNAPSIISFPSPLVRELVQYTSVYAWFVFLTLYAVPNLLIKKRVVLSLIGTVTLTVLIGVVFGRLDFGVEPLLFFISYSAGKHALIFLWSKAETIRIRFRYLAPGVLLTIVLWLVSMILFILGEAEAAIIASWVTLIPFGILLYSYSFLWLIPMAQMKKRPRLFYIARIAFILIIASFPVGMICLLITKNSEVSISIVLFNNLLQLFVTAPFSWIFYKRHKKGADQLDSLQKELGQSAANIDFLRSQINPHFLFNALNTVYGTAIQEKAERTSEAVQKLGDMMRFMLHENLQPKIMLTRELEYLHNYISLQRLRTDTVPGISIETRIHDDVVPEQIPPMLLIPFVENAFKHGISFREPSYIRISLDVIDETLHFNVSNSMHTRSEYDPEKDKSGIGLNNVKQRLQLLYPGRHELIIRETGREFFIHLTIQLS